MTTSHPSAPEHGADEPVPALAAGALSKTFAGVPALDGLDLHVAAGEVHALLGENGSGKSTFIKILSGYHQPDPGGSVRIAGVPMDLGQPGSSYAAGCRFVHQDLGLVDELSVGDNLSLTTGFPTRLGTIRSAAARQEARDALARVGLDVDPRTPVGDLSPARRTGVAVARALRSDARSPGRLLVLDEPTATLPDVEVRHLLDIVRQVAGQGVGVVYVTHRLDEVFQVADRVTVLRAGRAVASRRTADLDRATLVGLLVGDEFEQVSAASARLPERVGDPVLQVSGLVAQPVAGVDIELAAGEVVGVAGITGSGRESLLSAVFGGSPREGGVVRVAGGQPLPAGRPDRSIRAGMAYLPPDRASLGGMMDQSARENLTLADLPSVTRWARIDGAAERSAVARWFTALAIRPADGMDRALATFSGGNQQKLLFGKWLRREPVVFLLDEPTQGVDVGAKALLHRQLLDAAARGTAVLVSSSDVDELVALCSRVLVLRGGRVTAELRGEDVTVRAVSRAALGDTAVVAA